MPSGVWHLTSTKGTMNSPSIETTGVWGVMRFLLSFLHDLEDRGARMCWKYGISINPLPLSPQGKVLVVDRTAFGILYKVLIYSSRMFVNL